MKRLISSILLFFTFFNLFAQEKETYLYAQKDTSKLYMDVYLPQVQNEQQACLIFAFGGGFIGGRRDDSQIQKLKKYYTDKGFVVIAIDYRLGMRGKTKSSAIASVKQFQAAIDMAAEDMISALDYTLKNLLVTKKYTLNPKHIILMGSSAGAITVLQTDYALCNGYLNSDILPDSFRLAGVISYSGAIFSTHGTPKYKLHEPAPTLLCHGDKDKLVIYNNTRFFNIGLFGSNTSADDVTDEVFADTRKQREDDNVVIEVEMGCHRLAVVGFQHTMAMIGDVYTRFCQMGIVERFESIELFCALLGSTVSSEQMTIEVDAHLWHHSMAFFVFCCRHLYRGDKVLLAIRAQLSDGQL